MPRANARLCPPRPRAEGPPLAGEGAPPIQRCLARYLPRLAYRAINAHKAPETKGSGGSRKMGGRFHQLRRQLRQFRCGVELAGELGLPLLLATTRPVYREPTANTTKTDLTLRDPQAFSAAKAAASFSRNAVASAIALFALARSSWADFKSSFVCANLPSAASMAEVTSGLNKCVCVAGEARYAARLFHRPIENAHSRPPDAFNLGDFLLCRRDAGAQVTSAGLAVTHKALIQVLFLLALLFDLLLHRLEHRHNFPDWILVRLHFGTGRAADAARRHRQDREAAGPHCCDGSDRLRETAERWSSQLCLE